VWLSDEKIKTQLSQSERIIALLDFGTELTESIIRHGAK
jgi:hypothetical protein